MHAVYILHQHLRRYCPRVHLRRLTALLACVVAAVHGQRMTLTELGRALPSQARVKHSIKRVDRLLGNAQLGCERFDIYRAIARWLLADARRPIIVVDWSDLTADRRWQLLRAATPIGGRTLTVYEEVHPLRHCANPRVHRVFLHRLKAVLREDTVPILITDAGFRGPWFKTVSQLGWHWIGRVRNRDHVRAEQAQTWVGCKSLYAQANARAQGLGLHELVRSNPVRCHLYLIKRRKKHRLNKSVFGNRIRSNQSLKQERAQREPWLLAAAPSLAGLEATEIVKLYAQRMQIEEAFRDLKCDRYGLGFALNLSRGRERIAALLLIASLALFVLWQIGSAAIVRCVHLHYQSNTRKTPPVLSVITLARLLLRPVSYSSPPRNLATHMQPSASLSPALFNAL